MLHRKISAEQRGSHGFGERRILERGIMQRLLGLLLFSFHYTKALSTMRPHKLFVYGTLKRGYYNHATYLAAAEKSGAARFVAQGRTLDKFCLTLVGPRCIPALWDLNKLGEEVHGMGRKIEGEVFEISENALEAMDLLEGVVTGHYYRVKCQVHTVGNDGDEMPSCWVYLQEPPDKLDSTFHEQQQKIHGNYTAEMHKEYVPLKSSPDERILELLR